MQSPSINYAAEWQRLTHAALTEIRPEDTKAATNDQRVSAVLRALPEFLLACFCEREREKSARLWEPLEGFKPAYLHLMDKHHWTLETVCAMSAADLCLALHSELLAMQMPEAAKEVVRSDAAHYEMAGLKLGL